MPRSGASPSSATMAAFPPCTHSGANTSSCPNAPTRPVVRVQIGGFYMGLRASLWERGVLTARATLGCVHERFVWVRQRWVLILVLVLIVIGLTAALLGHDANNAYP